jgi:hypothetical protein
MSTTDGGYRYSVQQWISLKEWNTSKDGFKNAMEASTALLLKLREQQGEQQQQESVDVTLHNFQEQTKKDIQKLRSWAKVKIRNFIVKEAQDRRLKILGTEEIVTELSHLNDIFEADGTLGTAQQLWYCFFGIFDKVENWKILLEKEYMEEHKIGYRECRDGAKKPTLREKGCIAQIIQTVKNGMVDVLNRRAQKEESHGNKLGTRETGEVLKRKDARRQHGVFQPFFYRDREGNTVTKDPIMKNPSSPAGKSKRRKMSSDIPKYVSDITQVSRSSSLQGPDDLDPEKEALRKEVEQLKAQLAATNKNVAATDDSVVAYVLEQNQLSTEKAAIDVLEDPEHIEMEDKVVDTSDHQLSAKRPVNDSGNQSSEYDLEYQPSEYEKAAMEKRKRNEEHLASLGLGSTIIKASVTKHKQRKAPTENRNKKNEKRQSSRLHRKTGDPVSLDGMPYFLSLMIVHFNACHLLCFCLPFLCNA